MLLTSLFIRLFLRLVPVIILLCVLIPALGGRSLAADASLQQLGFSVCDLPCFGGILPGKTAFNELPDLLHRSIPLIGNRMFYNITAVNFWASFSSAQLAGWARNNQGIVSEIRLTSSLPFDYLLAQLGTPDCVLSGDQRSTVVFWIRGSISVGAVLEVDERDFNPSNHISALWLRNLQPDDCEASGALAWHGFAIVAAYDH